MATTAKVSPDAQFYHSRTDHENNPAREDSLSKPGSPKDDFCERCRSESYSPDTLKTGTPTMIDNDSFSIEEDSLLNASPSPRKHSFLENIRPRSKSDSKGKMSTGMLTAIKKTYHSTHWFNGSGGHSPSGSTPLSSSPNAHNAYCSNHHNHHHQNPQTFIDVTSPDGFDYKCQPRSRSGSESKGSSAVTKVIDLFRNRSQSVSVADCKQKKSLCTQCGSLIRRHSVETERRKTVTRERSCDGYPSGHHNTALIHRTYGETNSGCQSATGLASSETSICDRIDTEDLGVDETLLFVKFFKHYHCYDLIPLSAKLVVFDSQLLVKKAFFALVSNGVRAAPLWDSAAQKFVGMLTITDFIHILRKYYKSPTIRMDELEEHKIDTWRTVLEDMQRPLVSIGPDASLCEAITALINSKVHRLPVIDTQTGNVLYVLTHKRILRFLFLYYYELPQTSYVSMSIEELNVGTFENIATCSPSTPLITALNMFIDRRVSAIPVVDEESKVVDIYAKFDVINLAAEKTYNNLDMSVGKALEFRNQYFEGVSTCKSSDSLLQVMETIVKAEVHRLVIVDNEGHVEGIVSLSDILTFLVLTPLGMERPTSRAYFSRTTSADRENGTVQEEPELEATANVLGEQAVESEREKQRSRSDSEPGGVSDFDSSGVRESAGDSDVPSD